VLVAVASTGQGSEALVSQVLGRCAVFVLHDTATGSFESCENPALGQAGGAGIKAAEHLLRLTVDRVIGVNFGPKAFSVLQASGVQCFRCPDSLNTGEAIRMLAEGKLEQVAVPNAEAHSGTQGKGGRS
jgi:predicted Fe-Mo cluster-binding NifX family protein